VQTAPAECVRADFSRPGLFAVSVTIHHSLRSSGLYR